jgi:hypothetical protein
LAWPPSQSSQELNGRRLANSDPFDLLFAMGGVIRDVVWALIASGLHI